MKNLTGNQVRAMFLEYFKSKGHMIEPGASLVPVNDPTLLWINSGVAALKKYLDGREKPKSNRIANAQKCIRTNDIENVGKTSRHHTFFEMLGNWSIGDYFKEESLKMSWEFLTSPDWIGFDPDRIYVTVYPDDQESYDIWTKQIGLNPNHILKSYDNYWQIGEGPCGPDSEIYYDRGEKYDPEGIGERLFFEEIENDRYVELWNNVFSQYDAKEGVDRKDFKELPQKNIDTGMGLERLVAMIQDGETNFDTDLFLPYIHAVENFTKVKYQDNPMAFRVIADHIRTCVFALADGATFSNEGRGYVLRRVLRRAMRYGKNIGIEKPFLYEIVDIVCENMKDFYPYLMEKKDFIKKLILKEEESFLVTLSNGEKLLQEELKKASNGILSGEVMFKLYDTYGFPKEMTMEYCDEANIKYDLDGFNSCMEKQRQMARNARDVEESMHNQSEDLLNFNEDFVFTGYEKLNDNGKVLALFKDGKKVDQINDEGDIILDKSCFYAESGGQVADTGTMSNELFECDVTDVKKAPNGQFLHHIVVKKGNVNENDELNLSVNQLDRKQIMANHSSVHLLQAALIKVLGNHVGQAGSYVCKDYARFDFSHYEKVSKEQLKQVERLVNEYINMQLPISCEILALEDAKKSGAIALFDEKYGDTVRVVSMGNVSKEFCGGTHAENTADLATFKILSEESIGSGIRRIESCTKMKAYDAMLANEKMIDDIQEILKTNNKDGLLDYINNLKLDNSKLNSDLKQLNEKLLNQEASSIVDQAKQNNKFKYLLLQLDNYQNNLKEYALSLKGKIDGGFIFVVNKMEDKLTMVACAGNKANDAGVDCGNIIKDICQLASGKGGGKKDLAQGGCPDYNINEIFDKVENIINK